MSWPVKKMKEIGQHIELASNKKREKEIGQHVELAGKKNEWEANTLSWLVKIHMRSKIADV